MLTAVARRKQGNQQLNWGNWLKIPENRYLYEVNKDIAKGIFEDTNALISRIQEAQGGGKELTKFNNSLEGSSDNLSILPNAVLISCIVGICLFLKV